MRLLLPALIVLSAATVLACEDALLPLPQETPPQEMEFSTGGFAANSFHFEVRGDSVVATITAWGSPTPQEVVRRRPSAAEWRAFWDVARGSGVPRWGVYRNENVVDGGGYSLLIVNGGRVLESSGSNAYPDERGREHHEPTEAYSRFRTALNVLAGLPVAQ